MGVTRWNTVHYIARILRKRFSIEFLEEAKETEKESSTRQKLFAIDEQHIL